MCVGMAEFMFTLTFVALGASTLTNAHLKMEKWACVHRESLHIQKEKCLCHMTLSANQSSLQWAAAMWSVAKKSRQDPEDPTEKHHVVKKTEGSGGGGRSCKQTELATDLNGGLQWCAV